MCKAMPTESTCPNMSETIETVVKMQMKHTSELQVTSFAYSKELELE